MPWEPPCRDPSYASDVVNFCTKNGEATKKFGDLMMNFIVNGAVPVYSGKTTKSVQNQESRFRSKVKKRVEWADKHMHDL